MKKELLHIHGDNVEIVYSCYRFRHVKITNYNATQKTSRLIGLSLVYEKPEALYNL